MKIALIQSAVSFEKERNLANAEAAVRSLPGDTDFAVLPEMFICPYRTELFPTFAQAEGESDWQRLSALAAEKNIYLVAGSVPERDCFSIYNTSYVFDRKGRQIAKHRKIHMFDIAIKGGQHFRESDSISPGRECTVFDTEFGKAGLCICYDLRFPELARKMTLDGAKVIFVPAAFNMTTGPAHWELLFRQRAVDNQLFMIGAAPARDPALGYVSWGHSIACDPWGRVITQMEETPAIRIIDIDLAFEEAVREQLPLLKGRRPEVY